jgi:hypothetical protein
MTNYEPSLFSRFHNFLIYDYSPPLLSNIKLEDEIEAYAGKSKAAGRYFKMSDYMIKFMTMSVAVIVVLPSVVISWVKYILVIIAFIDMTMGWSCSAEKYSSLSKSFEKLQKHCKSAKTPAQIESITEHFDSLKKEYHSPSLFTDTTNICGGNI